jgi:hypothetical protein
MDYDLMDGEIQDGTSCECHRRHFAGNSRVPSIHNCQKVQARGPKTITGESCTGVLSVRGSAMTQTRGGDKSAAPKRAIHVINQTRPNK